MAHEAAADGVNVQAYLRVLLKRRMLILVSLTSVLALAGVYLLVKTPVWRAVAKLQFGAGMDLPLREVYKESSGPYIGGQLELLSSAVIKERVARRVREAGWTARLPAKALAPRTAYRIRPGDMIEITADGTDRAFVLFYVKAIIEELLALKAEQKDASAVTALAELTGRVSALAAEIKADEQRLAAFERRHNIVAYEQEGNLAAKQAADLQYQLSGLTTQRKIIEMQLRELEKGANPQVLQQAGAGLDGGAAFPGPGGSSTPPAGDADAVRRATAGASAARTYAVAAVDLKPYQDIRRQKQALEAELERALAVYLETHPKVQALREKIADAEAQAKNEVENLRGLLASRGRALEMEETAVRASLKELEAKAMYVSSSATEYLNLKNEIDRKQKLYLMLFERANQINISGGMGLITTTVLEEPRVLPGPVAPKRKKVLVLAFALGLGIGLGLTASVEYLDDTIKTEEDIEKTVAAPLFATVPREDAWTEEDPAGRIVDFQRWSPSLEAFRKLRTNIIFSSADRDLSVITVTSSVPREGKSVTSVNLAVSFAQMDVKTLLVDGDLRKGNLHQYFGLDHARGVSTILAGQDTPESVIRRTRVPNLDLLPCGELPPNPAELLSSPAMRALVTRLAAGYQRVIIDTAPVMTVPDGVILASLSRGSVFVVYGAVTSRKVVRRAVAGLRAHGAAVIGTVLNNVRPIDLEYGPYAYRYEYAYRRERAENAGSRTA